MRRLVSMFLGSALLLALFGTAWAASEQAVKLRGQDGLLPYTPPESFLAGNFVADEVEPGYIFGKVREFAASRSCPTSWLIEEGEKNRIQARDPQSGPVEYTLYLEEDCPAKVTYYVFVDRSRANAAQWMEWRKQFHRSKAEPYYGAIKASLEQATQNGFSVDAELRFVEAQGNLLLMKPEDLLISELKFQPIYDLKQAKAVAH